MMYIMFKSIASTYANVTNSFLVNRLLKVISVYASRAPKYKAIA
jgi:hypothetical protein